MGPNNIGYIRNSPSTLVDYVVTNMLNLNAHTREKEKISDHETIEIKIVNSL